MARSGRKKLTKSEVVEGMTEKMAAGIEVGIPVEELEAPHRKDALDVIGHMTKDTILPGGRLVSPHFVAEVDPSLVWWDGVTDRLQTGVRKIYTPEQVQQMKAGYQCMRCDEPQEESFPLQCSLCGYGMREYQIMHLAMEFEGETHIGPSKPISEALAEQDLRVEKAKFAKKLVDGRSPMKGLRHG